VEIEEDGLERDEGRGEERRRGRQRGVDCQVDLSLSTPERRLGTRDTFHQQFGMHIDT